MVWRLAIACCVLVACHRHDDACTEPESYIRDHDVDRAEHERLFGLWHEHTVVTLAWTPDLDGDGNNDVMAHGHDDCGSGGCAWDLFLIGTPCSRHVGWVLGDDLMVSTVRHEGMADLTTKFYGAVPFVGTHGSYEELHYEYIGGQYSRTQVRACDGASVCEPWRAADEP
jgi:hypothetical protein